VDVGELAREVAAEINQASPNAVAVTVAAGSPRLELPAADLRQILIAVLRARVTASGEPLRVEVGTERRDGFLRLRLTDDGRGRIPEQPFEPFAGAAMDTETGLGLFPVRHLAEGWGGRVEWTSNDGGAVFSITWKDAGHE
jgi:C4-dicarboxylate-specific signal transduction histidine kinase